MNMDEHAWDDLSAALMHRMHWSWRDLCETPMPVVEAVLDRLAKEQEQAQRAARSRGTASGERSVELG